MVYQDAVKVFRHERVFCVSNSLCGTTIGGEEPRSSDFLFPYPHVIVTPSGEILNVRQ